MTIEEQGGPQKKSPVVSVVIPAYRAAQFINAAIDSVLAQTFADYEIIVINDGSPDSELLEQNLQIMQPYITYFKQPNRGPAAARNAGVRLARGQFIAFLDADDYWLPNYLAEQLTVFANDPALTVVYADALLVGDSPLAGNTFMQLSPSAGEVTLEGLLAERCTVILSGTVVKKEALLKAGLFDEAFHYAEDFDLWLRLARSGARFSFQRMTLLHKREHKESLCADMPSLYEGCVRVIEKVEAWPSLNEAERWAARSCKDKHNALVKLERGKRELHGGNYSAAAEALAEAYDFYGTWKLRSVLFLLRLSPQFLRRIHGYLRPATIQPKRTV